MLSGVLHSRRLAKGFWCQAEAEVSRFSKELQETRRELELLDGRELILSLGGRLDVKMSRNEQLERQRVYGDTLIKARAQKSIRNRSFIPKWARKLGEVAGCQGF